MNEEKISPPGFTTPETPSGTPQPSGSGLKQTANETAQTAKEKLETLKSAAQEQGGAAVEEIKTVAQSATRQAQEAGRDFILEQKENLAQKVDQYTEAMGAACEKLRSEEGNVLAGPAQKAVDQLERMSDYLREKTARRLSRRSRIICAPQTRGGIRGFFCRRFSGSEIF